MGISKHSDSSFDEAVAIRLLSNELEKTRKIKTFFSENDKTPNHDGYFELVNQVGEPFKQFIVQIKKTSKLIKCIDGKNKGKYVYQLDTTFLYYIKKKVTESPAIYFVVDIDSSRIFYLYLSDEVLLRLGFEGKGHVSYAFSDHEILNDINLFYREMVNICNNRNQKYLYKTPEEMVEIQDAVDYINSLFSGEFRTIKEHMFPDLWRFAIGYSRSSDFVLEHVDANGVERKTRFPNTNMFGLYPQYKGEFNQEIREFQPNSFSSVFDLSGSKKPIDYVKDTVQEIIKKYCLNPPSVFVPSIALEEKIYKRAYLITQLYDDKTEVLYVDDIINKVNVLFSYIDLLFSGDYIGSENERIRQTISGYVDFGVKRFNPCNVFLGPTIKRELNIYYSEHHKIKYNIKRVSGIISKDILELLSDLIELKKRGVKVISCIWLDNYKKLQNDDIYDVYMIFDNWIKLLPDNYYQLYKEIFFDNRNYRYRCKVDYSIGKSDEGCCSKYFCNYVKYKSQIDELLIKRVDKVDLEFTETDKEKGVETKVGTGLLISLANNNQLIYDGIRCLLYQGICQQLGFKNDGLCINGAGIKYSIFD